MHLMIRPQKRIGKLSFRFGVQFLGKNNVENTFVALLTERDPFYTVWMCDGMKSQQVVSLSDKRYATQKKMTLDYRLAEEGARLIREINHSLGPLQFCLSTDDGPVGVERTVRLGQIVQGFSIPTDVDLFVTGDK